MACAPNPPVCMNSWPLLYLSESREGLSWVIPPVPLLLGLMFHHIFHLLVLSCDKWKCCLFGQELCHSQLPSSGSRIPWRKKTVAGCSCCDGSVRTQVGFFIVTHQQMFHCDPKDYDSKLKIMTLFYCLLTLAICRERKYGYVINSTVASRAALHRLRGLEVKMSPWKKNPLDTAKGSLPDLCSLTAFPILTSLNISEEFTYPINPCIKKKKNSFKV